MSKYHVAGDVTIENTSHAIMLDLVGGGKDVLDVGCATGYLAQALARAGNRVSGVEVDPEAADQARQHCARVEVLDVQTADLVAAFGPASFDVVVFGDVLEHLVDPQPVLRNAVGLLRPGGSVVISIPNIAHGSVRLALLAGGWTYRPLGLLDDTHVRFFDATGLEALVRGAGLVAVDRRRTTAHPRGTEIEVDTAALPQSIIDWVEEIDEAWTYQFVVRAIRDDVQVASAAPPSRRNLYRRLRRAARIVVRGG